MEFLFVLLEGSDDRRFFEKVFSPVLCRKYDKIIFYEYSGRPQKIRDKYVESLIRANSNYVIFSDFDNATCFTRSKDALQTKIPNAEFTKIAICKTEIESWYLAGINHASSRNLQITYYPTTDDISKEQFDGMMPNIFDSRIDFMQEILKYFDSPTAKSQNSSFRYVWNKFIFC